MENSEQPEVPIQLQAILGSKNIAAAGYDPDTAIMVVEYLSGAQYKWDGIPPSVYDGLRNAESPGKYMREVEAQFGKGIRIG